VDVARIQKGQVTRDRLIRAARDLVCERGIEGTHRQAVAAAAHSSVGALQSHFGWKNALLLAIYTEDRAVEVERLEQILLSLDGEIDRAAALVQRIWEGPMHRTPSGPSVSSYTIVTG
jgi:AcrR family transcriptional regulator